MWLVRALGAGVLLRSCVVLCAWSAGVGVARGQAEAVQVRAPAAACPDPAALSAQLQPLLPDAHVAPTDAPPEPAARARVEVRDLGAEYEVSVHSDAAQTRNAEGVTRRWRDDARNCDERARVVAVFVALNVPKPAAPEPEPEPDPAPDPAPQPEPQPEPARSPASLYAFGALAHAPAEGATGVGGGLGAALHFGGLRLSAEAAAFSALSLTLTPTPSSEGAVRLIRVPFVLGAGYLWRAGGVAFGPEAGLVLDVLHLRGEALSRAQTALRLNPGLSARVHVQADFARHLLGFVRLGVEAFPRAYALVVPPEGAQGQTPTLYLRLDLGLGVPF